MEIKKYTTINITKGDNLYQFLMPENAPLAEIYDCAYQILADMVKRMQEAADAAKPQETPSSSEEVVAEVVNS